MHLDSEHLCSPHIDAQLKPRRLIDGNLAWLRTFEDLIDRIGSAAPKIRKVDSTGDQATMFDEGVKRVNGWKPCFLCQINDQPAVLPIFCLLADDHGIDALPHRREGAAVLCLLQRTIARPH